MGGGGRDTLVGGHGDDKLDGGEDAYNLVDYSLEGGSRAISVNMDTGLVEDTFGTVDSLSNVGVVRGTALADWMKGGSADMIFDGGAGDDVLIAGSGLNELYGAAGNDVITTGERTSYTEGGMGNDTINIGAGYNVVAMGKSDGFDTVNGFKATDVLRLFEADMTAAELVAQSHYHEAADGRDGWLFTHGETQVFLSGVYGITEDQLQVIKPTAVDAI
jgi:Ca2+-binding RTX toxin-like protein